LALTSSLDKSPSGTKETPYTNPQPSHPYYNSAPESDSEFDAMGEYDLQPLIVKPKGQKESASEILVDHLSLEDMEKDMIRKALQRYRGKRKEAADELGISERTLYRKIKQYDL
jgi:transcriptional regulator with PAS, ATPase and Fis domain